MTADDAKAYPFQLINQTTMRARCTALHGVSPLTLSERELQAIRIELTRIADMLAAIATAIGNPNGLYYPRPQTPTHTPASEAPQ